MNHLPPVYFFAFFWRRFSRHAFIHCDLRSLPALAEAAAVADDFLGTTAPPRSSRAASAISSSIAFSCFPGIPGPIPIFRGGRSACERPFDVGTYRGSIVETVRGRSQSIDDRRLARGRAQKPAKRLAQSADMWGRFKKMRLWKRIVRILLPLCAGRSSQAEKRSVKFHG